MYVNGSVKISINYKKAAAMQWMRYGNTDVTTLDIFLDIPARWISISWYKNRVDTVMGHVQILKREESDIDDLTDEIQNNIDNDYRMTHECTIEGYEHPPIPLVKGSYGN